MDWLMDWLIGYAEGVASSYWIATHAFPEYAASAAMTVIAIESMVEGA